MMKSTKIGKDVIESLTMGMYEDSRFIYREYVQNSADQIDAAVESGLLESRKHGFIEIEINNSNKTVVILDNATGISVDKAEALLKNIAKSSKDRTKNKGFRGIGRLGGLGYCGTLEFETSFKGENQSTKLSWDAVKLREIINDRTKQQDAAAVIDTVTSTSYQEVDVNKHFFKVTLKNVRNDLLLNKTEIINYLEMVAPVPYNKGFIFAHSIHEYAEEKHHEIDTYNVFVNSDPVYKSYTSTIYKGEGNTRKRVSEIIEIQTFELTSKVWGWYSVSQNLTQQIPEEANPARGIRLRKGNIQIGGSDCLSRFFSENRFNYYYFGEVHVDNEDLIPNARRDYFVENEALLKFENDLEDLFSDKLSKLIRFASKVKSSSTTIKKLESFVNEYEEKNNQGFSGKEEKNKYDEEYEELKEKAVKAEDNLKKEEDRLEESSSKKKIFDFITSELKSEVKQISNKELNKKTTYLTDSLSKLDRKERKLLSKVFTIIDQVLPKDIASNLKEKIKEEFE